MKKQKLFILGILFLCSIGILNAQNLRIWSIEALATQGLFTNVLDSASTIDESATDIGFSSIGKSYFFGGISANPLQMANTGSSPTTVGAGYYHSAKNPWSLGLLMEYEGTGIQNPTNPIDNPATQTTYKYNYKLFNKLNTTAQFLINVGNISTGFGAQLNFRDSKDIDFNYDMSSPAGDMKSRLNNFTSDLVFFIPFFTKTGNLMHYASLNLGFIITDENGLQEASGNNSKTTDSPVTFKPSILYKIAMPVGNNGNLWYAQINTKFATRFYEKKAETTISGTTTTTTTKYEYSPGFNLALESGYVLNFKPAGDWLKFRMKPVLAYSLSSDFYETGSTVKISPASTTTEYANGLNSSVTNSVDFNLYSGMEIKPDNWIIGFMAGSLMNVGFSNTTTETRTVNIKGSPKSTTSQTVTNDWNTRIRGSFGVFIPLPENYRIDIGYTTGTNILLFGDLTVQLIVPLK